MEQMSLKRFHNMISKAKITTHRNKRYCSEDKGIVEREIQSLGFSAVYTASYEKNFNSNKIEFKPFNFKIITKMFQLFDDFGNEICDERVLDLVMMLSKIKELDIG